VAAGTQVHTPGFPQDRSSRRSTEVEAWDEGSTEARGALDRKPQAPPYHR
jgi:hypothetical protein